MNSSFEDTAFEPILLSEAADGYRPPGGSFRAPSNWEEAVMADSAFEEREDIEDAEETEEGKEEESMLEAAERAEEPLEFI